jgi:predicted DNA-binding transcriptional regulator YafY
MHPTRHEPFIFNPYQVVMSNGHYYLVGNYDKYDTISHFRIDRMTEMKLLEEPIKDTRLIKGMENGLNLPKHMAEHVYMFSGNSVSVLLKTDAKFMNDLVDWFGKDFQIMKKYTEDGADMMEIHVYCNEQAMEYWALQYGKRVTVLEPPGLREKIREDIEGMAERYR